MNVGLDQVIAAARDLGIDAPISPVPSLALGAVGVSLLDLTSAFASVRSDRMHIEAWGVAAVGPADRSQLWTARRPLISARTLDPYQKPLVDLLQGVIEYGTGRAAALGGVFAAGRRALVKTIATPGSSVSTMRLSSAFGWVTTTPR